MEARRKGVVRVSTKHREMWPTEISDKVEFGGQNSIIVELVMVD